MSRLLIVSNRLPVQPAPGEGGEMDMIDSVGGLATGLGSVYRQHDALWLGAVDDMGLDHGELEARLRCDQCVPVYLDPSDAQAYYDGFSNGTLWPVYHQFPQHAEFDDAWWNAYVRVNEAFADVVAANASPDDRIWIHDYHLQLLPALLRKRLPRANIGFFLHIPFPSFEIFRMLPQRTEILDGLLGADLVGFHTYDYVRHFLSCCLRLRGWDNSFGRMDVRAREVRVDAFPMGIDQARFADAASTEEVREAARSVRAEFARDKMILSLDRLDYTKGILERVRAYDRFLVESPEWRGRVTLALVAVPSRINVEQYQRLKRELDELVGQVNGRHGSIDWTPVRYIFRPLEFTQLVAFYRVADVMLVTPLRDGMNLVSKEYVAVKGESGKGVLVLSEFAGAAREFAGALVLNPFDQTAFVEAIRTALEMPETEQRTRLDSLLGRVRRYTVTRWAEDYLAALDEAAAVRRSLEAVRMSPDDREWMLSAFFTAENRILLLDYDGTLVPLVPRFEAAGPDEVVLDILRNLTSVARTDVVIVSGRTRADLERWFDGIPLTLIAEHGGFVRRAGAAWVAASSRDGLWKGSVRPVMELYVSRTPRSRIEEKEISLVFHYRESDPDLGALRARDLRDALEPLIANEGLALQEGSRVLEVRAAGTDKGQAAASLLAERSYDFILAAGDDRTDEDMFAVLPPEAWTLCVSRRGSRARYRLGSVEDLRTMLASLRR